MQPSCCELDPLDVTSTAGAAVGDAVRCAIDTVEIARIERLLAQTPAGDLAKLFSERELADAGEGPGRAASLAARFAAKEACQKLFPRETALVQLDPADFAIARDAYGAPLVTLSPRAQAALARQRLSGISVSLTHTATTASAVALALPRVDTPVPLAGRFIYRWLPIRRAVIVENLRRVFGEHVGEREIERLAQAHYAHLWTLLTEFLRYPWYPAKRKRALVRVEGVDEFTKAWRAGRGVLVLTGHFGNFEVATLAGLTQFPEVHGRIHFVRRPIKPRWLDALVNRRMRRAGFGTIGKRGSLDAMLAALEAGDAIVFPFDQHARRPDGIEVEFFGHPAGTFRSLAIIALATGAPVLPASCWRNEDGMHVLRFEPALEPIASEDADEAIRRTTRAYNEALERLVLRHPEQWWWVHRRWKTDTRPPHKRSRAAARGPV
jgi:KDO2-lipid IV(A) lauroyltransferase